MKENPEALVPRLGTGVCEDRLRRASAGREKSCFLSLQFAANFCLHISSKISDTGKKAYNSFFPEKSILR